MHIRIREARKSAGFSQQVVADACGVTRNAVTLWESVDDEKRTEPSIDFLKIISNITGRPLLYLLDELDGLEFPEQSVKKAPLISWVQAGNWSEAINVFETGDAEDWLPHVGGGNNVYCLRIKGDSMTNPYGDNFPEGHIIWVDPDQRNPSNGDYVIAKIKGEDAVTFKQYKVDEAENPYLKPLNTNYKNIFDEFIVLGKIIWSGKSH